ncbi:MAG TPA: NYN domain-containing protein [Syntrophorhabdales bacterium]|nr:NYN domain-containing protein [Syntrophorhabdales bacterium]
MPPHLLIDGYNYIGRTSLAGMFGPAGAETAREYLLNQLVEYRNEKHVKITVVFDAYAGVHLARSRTNYKGIEVIYSGRDETADDVIRQMIQARPTGLVVVSSDRALIDEAKRYGVVFMVPGRLEAALAGEAEQDEAHGPERKGTARKLPKRVRRARRTLGKV